MNTDTLETIMNTDTLETIMNTDIQKKLQQIIILVKKFQGDFFGAL